MVSPLTPPPVDPAQVAKAAADAAAAASAKSNELVQAAAPTIMSYVSKYWYVWVAVVVALCIGGAKYHGG